MLILKGDGTYDGGPLDVILILGNVHTKKFHVALFEESPFPGPVPDIQNMKVVRLKSKMHHTGGATDWAEAQIQMDDLCAKIALPESNVLRSEVFVWDGELGITLLSNNWLSEGGKPRFVSHSLPPEQFLQAGASIA